MRTLAVPASLARAATGLLVVALGSCIDAYVPEVISAPTSYLVVDGFINGNGATRVKLSRTQNIATTAAPTPEARATVYIQGAAGARYSLRERSPGFYQSDSLVLGPGQYQLRVSTTGANAATYESAPVPLKVTPPIDKLSWRRVDNEVRVLLNTRDATQQTRYYRWKFAETWEFNSAYKSSLEYFPDKKVIGARTTPIYTCWRTEQPTGIKQATSAQLSQDALLDYSILSFSDRAERLKIRYSVLVTQYAQTAEEFAYYEQLRKNTEAIGTVNDPLPVQLTGNVRRTSGATTEPVLGYVGAHTVQQRRFFINRAELSLPADWAFDSPYTDCKFQNEDVTEYMPPLAVPKTKLFETPNYYIPIDYYYSVKTGDLAGYSGALAECVDCRLRGSITKPSFW
ncbi:DUF4249 domain-containing protein [Hymenobacter sp. BT559]|uniref:DUF4249 domain-containing protein n=1 Tax=Hymenobacter sp. BT559 TaxID=2795729 RepID=UPI0018EB8FF7|nr:DUF4249 domain-containing protein [Hymenobacter sp. BT559]MBJ6143240.1 DUF4249 domain-containing protein [Hymenobacter sp. BT559]